MVVHLVELEQLVDGVLAALHVDAHLVLAPHRDRHRQPEALLWRRRPAADHHLDVDRLVGELHLRHWAATGGENKGAQRPRLFQFMPKIKQATPYPEQIQT